MTTSNIKGKILTNKQIYSDIARRCGISEKTVQNIIEELRALIISELKYKGKFLITGFFSAERLDMPASECFVPSTREKVFVPAKSSIKLKPSPTMVNDINGRFVYDVKRNKGKRYKPCKRVEARLTEDDEKYADFLLDKMFNARLEEDEEE